MKKLFVSGLTAIFLALIFSGLGMAQDPQTTNTLGLYEFSDGTGATGTSDIGTPVTAYLVLKNPADVENGNEPYLSINAFECRLNFNPPGNLYKLSEILPPYAGDDFEPSDINAGYLEYVVGLSRDYFFTGDSVVLVTFAFMHTAPGNIEVTLGPTFTPAIPGEMAFQSVVGELRVMHPASGSHDIPVYYFGHGPDPVVGATFGSVKVLYR